MRDFSEEQKYRILDLGKANGATVASLSRLRCKLFVGDVIAALLSHQKSLPEGEPPGLMLQDMIGLDDLSELDLVLCWDIINYLDAAMIEVFSDCLHQLMANGGYLHAFIYTHKEMPAEPGNYRILDASKMDAEYPVDSLIPAPAFAQRGLGKLMRGFEVRQSRLLQNGMQEYLFRRL